MSFSKTKDEKALEDCWTWDKELYRRTSEELKQLSGVPVDAFFHVPFGPMIHDIVSKERVVEVKSYHEEYTLNGKNVDCYWFAKVLMIYGYMVKIRYLGFSPEDEEEKFEQIERFVHMKDLYRIGYCRENNLPMIPPVSVENINDVTEACMESLIGNMSLFILRDEIFDLHLKSKYKIGNKVEVPDRTNLGRMRLAYVVKIIGKRISVTYWDSVQIKDKDLKGFWVHEMSEDIKPCGFSKTVGIPIHAPQHYEPEVIRTLGPITDSKILHIIKLLKVDMVFEVIHPIKPKEITTAKVVKVLKYGYFICKLLCKNPPNEGTTPNKELKPELFFFNISSPKIFPCGFCESHGIILQPPEDADEKQPTKNFDWEAYCLQNGYTPLPIDDLLEDKQVLNHKFKVNSKLEAVDMNVPELICPCTIKEVIHPFLVKIGFLGWGQEFDQWKPINSTEMYPIGFCQLVGLPFEAPLNWDEVGIKEEDEVEIPEEESVVVNGENDEIMKSPEPKVNHQVIIDDIPMQTDDYDNYDFDEQFLPKPILKPKVLPPPIVKRRTVKTPKTPIEIKIKSSRPAKTPTTTKTTTKQESLKSKVQDVLIPDAIEDTDSDVNQPVRRSTRKSKRPNCFGENIALKVDSNSLDL